MLLTFQTMELCLRTGFGESSRSFGGTIEDPMMGLGQGSGAGPPSFSVLSGTIVNAYKRLGNCALLKSSITARIFLLAAVMYVDDADLLHLGHSQDTTDEEMITAVQQHQTDWGMLAQASGGSLNAKKCGAYLMLYKFVQGKASLKKVRAMPPPGGTLTNAGGLLVPAHFTVPMPVGSSPRIPTLEVTQEDKMLGVFFSPAGDGSGHLLYSAQ